MMNTIILLFRFLFNHKWKIGLVFILTSVFLFLLFPLGDLNDFISSKVSQLTKNQVFLQFDEMHFNPLTTTLKLDKVLVETAQIDHLTIDSLSATPSILALISQQPGGHIFAEGLLGGTMNVHIKPASSTTSETKSEMPLHKSDIDLILEKISLKEIKKLVSSHLPLSGTLDLNASMVIDPAFIEQPEGDLHVRIQKFNLQNASIQLPDNQGGLNLPELEFSTVELKGKLQAGRFTIETGKLGSLSDDFSGNIKGDLGITIQNINGQMQPLIGSYNLSIDLIGKPAFKSKAEFFLNLIPDQYKKDEIGSTRYKFKLVSTGPGIPPQWSSAN